MAKTELMALWKKKGQSGKVYCSGYHLDRGTKHNIIGFYNTNKKNPKQPDVEIYKQVDGKREEKPILSLWCNVDKNGKKYLSGKYLNVRVVGFINDKGVEVDSKYPHFSIYYSADKKEAAKPEVEKQVETPKQPFDIMDDIPF